MTIKAGDIVRADIHDPDGKPCAEPHRTMVLRTDGVNAWLVGISTKFTEPPPRHWIRLPFAPGGGSITGLVSPCVLKCNWVKLKPVCQLSAAIGTIPPEIYDKAVDLVLAEVERKKAANPLLQKSS